MTKRTRWILALGVLVLAVATFPVWFGFAVFTLSPSLRFKAMRVKSADNMRSLLFELREEGYGVSRPWPSLSGKRFLLAVLPRLQYRRFPGNLEILFSPADRTRTLAAAGGVPAYDRVTPESLRTESVDVDPLTSYLGPRGLPDAVTETASPASAHGRPLIADLFFEGGALVGFADGAALWMTRQELGLPPGAPIVAGEASESPILRQFGP